VDILTADGALDVELEVDPAIRLAPDEQIEVFRIVQEGLANARRHAGARRARGSRSGGAAHRLRAAFRRRRPGTEEHARAAAIGGVFSLTSAPGGGTALEVVLRR